MLRTESMGAAAPGAALASPHPESVTVTAPSSGEISPLLVEPAAGAADLLGAIGEDRSWIDGLLRERGALLFRGFDLAGREAFERFIEVTSTGRWAEYREAATPRTAVTEKLATSTEYPPERRIYLHNENSHCTSWPLKIYFLCEVTPEQGGETPIADCRRVLERIDPAVRQRFAERGWMYIRNFRRGLGFDWRQVFACQTPAEVEDYCRRNDMTAEWRGEQLRVRYVRPAVRRHPVTGEAIWFNHGTFFHASTLEPEIREILLAELDEEDLAYHTCYGDGGAIEPEVMDHLRQAYDRETVCFPWRRGDLFMLDNMVMAHGRRPYRGERRVIVGMTDPYAPPDAS